MPRQERIEGSERVERLRKKKRRADEIRPTEVWMKAAYVCTAIRRYELSTSTECAMGNGYAGYLKARVVFGPHTTPDRRVVIFLREKPEKRFLSWKLPEDVAAFVTPNGEKLFGEWREFK